MTQIDSDTLAQLSAALAAAGLGLLELRGPGVLLRLGDDADAETPREPIASVREPARRAASSSSTVNAESAGVFLHTHPMHTAPLAPIGTQVSAGAPIGLLQIGALLLPVRAPRAAVIAGLCAAHGTTVGYGTPLVDLVAD